MKAVVAKAYLHYRLSAMGLESLLTLLRLGGQTSNRKHCWAGVMLDA
jgi:hypothetical protein